MNASLPDITLSPSKLVAARHAAGLSQREAHQAAGISRATLQFAEAGERTPQVEHLAALARVYGVTVDSLLTELDGESLVPERAHAPNLPGSSRRAPHGTSEKTTDPGATSPTPAPGSE
jgi:transcriptional regulator with XRE-family HTH domain